MPGLPTVLLAHTRDGAGLADRVETGVSRAGPGARFCRSEFGNWLELTNSARELGPGDFFVVLVTQRLAEPHNESVFSEYFMDLKRRDVSTVPVLVDPKASLPGFFRDKLAIKADDTRGMIDRVLKGIEITPFLRFDRLTPSQFANLSYELLVRAGFQHIQRDVRVGKQYIDFVCSEPSARRSAFSPALAAHYWFAPPEPPSKYFVEVKFYWNDRPGISAMDEFVRTVGSKEGTKGIVITNSQLTSIAENYVNEARFHRKIDIDVVDGPQLRGFLFAYPDLAQRYFRG